MLGSTKTNFMDLELVYSTCTVFIELVYSTFTVFKEHFDLILFLAIRHNE